MQDQSKQQIGRHNHTSLEQQSLTDNQYTDQRNPKQIQASKVQLKSQNSKKMFEGKHQSEQQPTAQKNNTDDNQPTKENIAKDQWQTQKKKNFRGVNQRNKQQR